MPSSARKPPSSKPLPRSARQERAAPDLGTVPQAPAVPPIDTTEALPAGTVVGSFVLGALVERSDFGLHYRATASASDTEVLIEEYWPAALVERGSDDAPVPREAGLAALFDAGLEAFVDEARQLEGLDHPALVKIGPVWRLRGSACRLRVEPIARRLGQHMQERARPPDERWLRALAGSLMDALDAVHRIGRIHGNLRPGQVAMRDDESPVLLEFEAARAAIARLEAWRAPQPEPAFAAPELQLYGAEPTPTADVYSLAALLWFCSTGELPGKPSAARRAAPRWEAVLRRDPSLRYSAGWMQAIDAALVLDAAARPPTVEAFRQLLAGRPEPSVAASRRAPGDAGVAKEEASPVGGSKPDFFASEPGRLPESPAVTALFDGLPLMRAVDGSDGDSDREPTWQLEDFASAVLDKPRAAAPALGSTPRVDDEPWPTATRGGLFDAPTGAPAVNDWRAQDRPAPLPAPKSRHWRWGLAGVLVGGMAMLVLGLGWDRIVADTLFDRFDGLATNAAADGPVLPAEPTAAGGAVVSRAETGDALAARPADVQPLPGRSSVPSAESLPIDAGGAKPTAGLASSTVTPVEAERPRAAARVANAEVEPTPRAPARGARASEADPASACAPRTNFSLYMCMKTQCERSASYAHPQCIQFRRDEQP